MALFVSTPSAVREKGGRYRARKIKGPPLESGRGKESVTTGGPDSSGGQFESNLHKPGDVGDGKQMDMCQNGVTPQKNPTWRFSFDFRLHQPRPGFHAAEDSNIIESNGGECITTLS